MFFGGQDAGFFEENAETIQRHNSRMLKIVVVIMFVISALYALFDLNSSGLLMRFCYVGFCLLFLALHIRQVRFKKDILPVDSKYFIYPLIEIIFAFLILVGPVFDSGNIACYLPVFFLVVFLLFIEPLHRLTLLVAVDFAVACIFLLICKDSRFALIDIVDCATCMIFGLAMGVNILQSRVSNIFSYSLLEKRSEAELAKALEMANKDPLTGLRSRAAYEKEESVLDKEIALGSFDAFALVVCDINNLKETNDNRGHDVGDMLICECAKRICGVYVHSPVFRIGGDEFAVLLRGGDYARRRDLLLQLRNVAEVSEIPLFAFGMAEFDWHKDYSVNDVFIRADSAMYENKNDGKKQ